MLNLLSHFMKYLVILVGLVLTANVQSHPSVCQQSKQRDLSKYDFGGAFEVKVSREGIGRVDAEVRAFIWRHVKEQQLGYVSVTHYSKEGEPSTSTYFVEQDENGGWHMLVRIERRIIDNRESTFSKFRSVVTEYVPDSIQRIDSSNSKPIHENAVCAPESYRLLLKDKRGKVLAEI